MKCVLALVVLGVAVVSTAGTLRAADTADGWFDLANCVTTVDPTYEEAYGRAMEKMNAAGAKLAAGEKLPMCGCCESMGALMTAGAKMDNVDTNAGHVMLFTSTDPALITKIQAHCDRTNAEYEKMKAAEAHSH
jgi:hypothetical protein